jgi:nucleoside-diphosphate-sugar epimerase
VKIAVTGASGQVGTLLRERLSGVAGLELTALGRGEDWGAAIAVADAVVHLAGTLQPQRGESYKAANVETTRIVADAAARGKARRIVFLSYVGAAAGSANAYLRSKAEAEKLLAGCGVPLTTFRCLHVFGPPERPGPTVTPFLAKSGKTVVVPGSGRQLIAPLFLGDVVSAVSRAATDPASPTGTFDLGGPEELGMDEFVRAVNGGAAKLRHLPAPLAWVATRLSPALTPALMDLLLRDNVAADAAGVAAAFGFEPTPLGAVWPAER